WSALGKFVYVKPLDLQSISPDEGTLEGYQTLELTADGLPPDVEQIQVYFGNQQAAQENFKLVANNRLQLLTPPGQLGKVSVRVVLSDGQEDILEDAYTYQQPIQSEIQTGQVTAMAIDPSATYMMVAAGQYLRIINIDPSAWTANNIEYDEDGQEIIRDPLNPDDLRRFIDLDGDDIDDRVVFDWRTSDGYHILGVQGYFERGNDLIYMAMAKPSANGFSDSKLVVLAVSDDLTEANIVRELPLPGDMARGLLVENNQVLTTLGKNGLGLVDAYLPYKAYLMDWASLSTALPTLDVRRATESYQGQPVYVTVAGDW